MTVTDAQSRSGSTTIALTVAEPPAPPIEISEIQGAAHLSPKVGTTVTTTGIVIGKIGSSFYIQDPTPDANSDTSEGLQVFGASAAAGVSVGDEVSVRGLVTEFRADATNLTITELTSPVATVLSTGNALPAATVIGTGGRIPPNTVIEDDATGNVEAPGVLFDPAEDGLDFYESMEGMLVQMNDLIATSFTFTNFGEIFVVGDNGANATTMTPRGGVVIGPGDLNPERMVIDDEWFKTGPPAMPAVNVGGTFPGAHVGILDYDFGEYRIQLRSQPVPASTGVSVRETAVAAGADQISIATFNVENLAGNEAQPKYDALAAHDREQPRGAGHRRSRGDPGQQRRRRRHGRPVVAANMTLEPARRRDHRRGRPGLQLPADQPGCAPGRRGAGRQHPRRLPLPDRPRARVRRSPGWRLDDRRLRRPRPGRPPALCEPGPRRADEQRVECEPQAARGRVHLQRPQAVRDREPLQLEGRRPASLRPSQPPVLTTEVQRNQQATLLADFVDDILALDPTANVAVIGDLNDFQFSHRCRS